MPLLQSRVVAIINAALDYKQALESMAGLISDLAAQSHSPNPPDRIELLETIHAAALGYQSQLKQPFNSPHVILSEYEYYSKNAARNAHNAEMLRQKRAARAGGPPRRHRAPIYAEYDLTPIDTVAERAGQTEPNAPHRYPDPSVLTTDESQIPEFARRGAEEYHARERERLERERERAEIEAALNPNRISDARREEVMREAEALRADLLSKAKMIMNQRNVTFETVQREAQEAYDDYIAEQTDDEGF